MTKRELRRTLRDTTEVAWDWFVANALEKTPADWSTPGGLEDTGAGAVYSFFDADDYALYVGQTGAAITTRANYETSRHYDAPWWKLWNPAERSRRRPGTLMFVNLPDETDRLTLELLLILSLRPCYNKKPRARNIGEMF